MQPSIRLVSIGIDANGVEVFAPETTRPSETVAPNQAPAGYGFWAWLGATSLLVVSIVARGYLGA